MEIWIILSLVAPFFWAASNLVDKIVVENYLDQPNQFMLLLSQFYSVVAVTYLIFFASSFSLNIFALSCGAMLFCLYYFYAKVLPDEEISSVILVHQIEPVFVLVIAVILLGIYPTSFEWVGFFAVLFGMTYFGFSKKGGGDATISRKNIILLIISAFFGGISTIFADMASEEISTIDVLGQSAIGYGISGIACLIISESYRKDALTIFQKFAGIRVTAMGFTGALDMLGYLAFFGALASSSNPGFVAVITCIHPAVVFVMGILFSVFAPHVYKEALDKSVISKKLISLLIVSIGIAFLSAN